MLCRFTPLARPMPTRGQGELAGRAQVSVSGRSPVLACLLGQCRNYLLTRAQVGEGACLVLLRGRSSSGSSEL